MEKIDSGVAKNRNWTGLAGALVLAVALSLFLHIQSWAIADPDGLYHFRHAWVYRTQGFFNSSFPWVQYSVIKGAGADLWYGFHFLLAPFTYIKDPLLALKTASFAATAAGVLLIFFSLKRLEIKWPHLWTVLFLTSAPDLFYRISALRPQLLSFGLSFLFFAYFFRPASGRRKSSAIFFVISFVSVWVHAALFWVNFIIFGAGSLMEKIFGKKLRLKEFLAAATGALFGFFLRPNPFQGFKLLYVQLIQNFIEKYKKTPLLWGTELLHFDGRNFADQFLPVIFLLLIAAFFLYPALYKKGGVYRFSGQRLEAGVFWQDFKAQARTAFAVGAGFLWLAFASARRSADYFFGFAIIIISLVFSCLFREKWKSIKGMIGSVGAPAVILTLAVILYMAGFSVYRYEYSLAKSYRPDRAREAAEWLAANSKEGDIVFHTRWEQFAELFFWNQKNYYINGMDPIFMYTFSPSLYWKQHFFAYDQATSITCSRVRCKQEEVEESYKVLKEDFRARYIYLQKQKNVNFLKYLSEDPRFEKAFENDGDVVFRIQ